MDSSSVTSHPSMDGADWRNHLKPESRQRIINQLLEALKRHHPLSGEEESNGLRDIAVRFEGKIYNAAKSQSDYLRKISIKMLSMGVKASRPIEPRSDFHPSNIEYPQMDSSSLNPLPPVDNEDWCNQLTPESRGRTVNKLLETLKRHCPVSGEEESNKLRDIAVRFEGKIYNAATSQSDYMRKISLKMLSMDMKARRPIEPRSDFHPSIIELKIPADYPQIDSSSLNLLPPVDNEDWRNQLTPESLGRIVNKMSDFHPSNIELKIPADYPQMDSSSMNPLPLVDNEDWHNQLTSESRGRIVNKILETLKRQCPLSGEEESNKLHDIAVIFEGKIYNVATSQSDYLRKISIKMLSMDMKARRPIEPRSDVPPSNRELKIPAHHPPMDSSILIPLLPVASEDWHDRLMPESRGRIGNKIYRMEIETIADQIEEKMCREAMNRQDHIERSDNVKRAIDEAIMTQHTSHDQNSKRSRYLF